MSKPESTVRYKEVLNKVEIMKCLKLPSSSTSNKPSTSGTKCSYCGKKFTNKFMLRRHEAIHTGERRYQCSECLKPFIQKTDLVRHEATHSDKKPYICEVEDCGRGHKTMKNLTSHIFRAHFRHINRKMIPKGKAKNPNNHYKCEICGKSHNKWINYIRHLQLHGNYRKVSDDGENLEESNEVAKATASAASTMPRQQNHDISTPRLVVKVANSNRCENVDEKPDKQNRSIRYEFVDENEFLPDENDPHELIRRHMKLVQTCNEPDYLWDSEIVPKLEPEEDEPCYVFETSGYRFDTDKIKEEP